jgi:hypothetical protein
MDGDIVKRQLLSFAVLFTLFVVCHRPAIASDAQAALQSGSASQPYSIPEHLSNEEKRWFKTFHEGNFLSEGWQEITAYLLARTPEEQRQAQKAALDSLGKKIALEWCRANDVRKVDSSMLQDWGDQLKAAADENPVELPRTIAFIDQEVEAVLD